MLSSIAGDPGIICFQHCTSKIFCAEFPELCPTCGCRLSEQKMKLLPFRLPYPFIRASQYPCAVVLRPTTGDFLNDYNNSTDLHIAVTTSKGTIVEFDRNGLQRHSDKSGQSSWSQCLLVENVPEPWHELWDEVLLQICKQPNWTTDDYNEEAYNCYTFVLTFLQAVGYSALSKDAENKTYFCEKYIVPRTTTAGKYISLYRKIRDYGLYTHSVGKDMSSHSGSSAAGLRGNFYGVKLCTIKE